MVGNDLSVYLYNHFLGKRLDIPSIIMLQDFVGISISKWVVINVFFFFFFFFFFSSIILGEKRNWDWSHNLINISFLAVQQIKMVLLLQ